jgi:hypothetical protein
MAFVRASLKVSWFICTFSNMLGKSRSISTSSSWALASNDMIRYTIRGLGTTKDHSDLEALD